MKRIVILFVTISLYILPALAGVDHKSVKQVKPINDGNIDRTLSSSSGQYIPGLDKPALLNWIPVDSMANAFSPASSIVKPIVYDPATGTLIVIHRGAQPYASGSGQLWYNVSRNLGMTWRRVGELNSGASPSCRYPTAAVSNPNNINDTSQSFFVYVANNLEGWPDQSCFTWGADFPLGGGAGMGFLECVPGSLSRIVLSTRPSSNQMFIAAQSTNHMLWGTTDYHHVDPIIPPTWNIGPPNFLASLGPVGLKSTHTSTYYGVQGLFYPDSNANAFNAGYSKSTNNSTTWSEWIRPQPDWMIATGLPPRYDLYDYVQPRGGTVLYLSDMVVDFLGRVHFFHVVVDSPWTNLSQRGILEVYETGSGWSYNWVTERLNPRTALGYPGPSPLNETGNAIHASITADGRTMAIVWLDAGSLSPSDTLPDIWISRRPISNSQWDDPVNLTQTPGFAELMLHSAPILEDIPSGPVIVFLGRSYQCDINTYPPDNSMKTTFYVSSFAIGPVVDVKEIAEPTEFRLEQNYPNPFNPTTSISYSVGASGFVSLKVYDILGREVATLVNEEKAQGQHDVIFDAGNLSSGLYYYRLRTDTFLLTRKLLLIR